MTKYFVTGATGFIGTVVVEELLKNGHQVVGLARSDASADKLIKAGAEVIKGDLEDPEALKKGARETDGVLHLGFIHDFSNYENSAKVDAAAVEVITEELKGTNKPFVYTSGILSVAKPIGETSYETSTLTPQGFGKKRFETEEHVLKDIPAKGIRATVIRLPPTVHGEGDKAFVPFLVNSAKEKGISYYIDEGKNTWPAVHRKDAAVLYRLVAENGVSGTAYHGHNEYGIEVKKIAEAIGEKLNVPVKSLPAEKAFEELGFIGGVVTLHTYASSEKTQKELGWKPKELGLLEDIKENY